jgi:hypothetical protein
VLSASDEAPGRPSETGVPNPHEGQNQWFTVARAQYAITGASYAGYGSLLDRRAHEGG